jgi:hypothetical protein
MRNNAYYIPWNSKIKTKNLINIKLKKTIIKMIVVPYLGVQAYLKNDTIFSKWA